jgi:hypothetical protein
MKDLAGFWPDGISAESIAFARSVIYSPTKTRYFNLADHKLSTSAKYIHDRRWEIVPSWADGGFESVCSLLIPDYRDGLSKFCFYQQLRRHPDISGSIDGCLVGIPGPAYDTPSCYSESAFYVVDSLVRAYRKQDDADRSIECLRHNLEMAKQRAAAA